MSRKECMFFIDAMTGGGAERVVSVLVPEIISKGIDVSIVMMRKKEIAYELPKQVHLYYAEDLPVGIYGKIVRKIFKFYNKSRMKWVPRLQRKGFFLKLPEWNETSFYFYSKFALPYREFLKKHKGCTAFGFLIRSSVTLAIASKGLDVHTFYCERSNPIRHNIQDSLIKLRDKYYPKYDGGVFQTEEVLSYYTKLKGQKTIILNPIVEGLPNIYEGEKQKEIVTFCRLGKEKNLPMLIDAFKRIRDEYKDYTLSIYGEGSEKEFLVDYINKLNLSDCAYIRDFRSDIHNVIRDCTVYVSTSDYEGLSNSMLEAMAIGLPCICTDCDGGGARMMIDDHKNGILVPKGDVNALYLALKEVIENPDLAQKMAFNAYKIREELTPAKVAQKWVDLIK